MGRVSVAASCLGWLLLLGLPDCACQEAGAPCQETADCPGGQVCAEDYCRVVCNTRADCDSDEACIDGACLPARARPDAAAADATARDSAATDLASRDLLPPDAARVDAAAADTAAGDGGAVDAAQHDQGAADLVAIDSIPPDTGVADLAPTDAAGADTGQHDAASADTQRADTAGADLASTDTAQPECGNSVVVPGETCDDGNQTDGDGCSATCQQEPGYSCTGAGPGSCAPVCGDGLIRGDETCDDGDATAGDGCSEVCKIEVHWSCTGEPSVCYLCGDGVQDPGEACDDGFNDACGDCDETCSGAGGGATCGDGALCPQYELCDHGPANRDDYYPAPTCNTGCDGYAPHCGDGLVETGQEVCDSGPASSDAWFLNPHCNSVCMSLGPFCGDGVVEASAGEQCDDGNGHHYDACQACSAALALPDTGQGDCYDSSGDLNTCPGPGLAFFGQDAQHGPTALSLSDNGDGTVTDHFTGLIWSQGSQSGSSWQGAADMCASSTLASHGDWRLPTVHELRNILNHGIRDPSLDPIFGLNNGQHWAAEAVASATGQHWAVDLKEARSAPRDDGNLTNSACVRGVAPPASAFVAQAETVLDTTYGLEWQGGPAGGPAAWQQALAQCATLDLDGGGWRLPNVKELGTLFDPTRPAPAIDSGLFETVAGSRLWSATTRYRNASNAFVLQLGAGEIDTFNKGDNTVYLRCVRDAPIRSVRQPLPDTGQAICFDLAASVHCPEPDAPLWGQDAQHGSNMRYLSTNADRSVSDRITGLTWLVEVQSTQNQGNAVNDCQNREELDYGDWRLPSLDELMSLLHLGRSEPAASAALQMSSGPYWTTTPAPPLGAGTNFWTVDFFLQQVTPTSGVGAGRRLCVRGPPLPESSYLDLGASVADMVYGLQWQTAPDASERDWAQALAYCAALDLEGAGDWRLPSALELHALVAPMQVSPAVDPLLAATTETAVYWSSSTHSADPTRAWAVDFDHGEAGGVEKIFAQGRTRCVRDLD